MATIRDKENIEKAMEECKAHPLQCRWVGDISFSYSDSIDKYIATFDCDLTVVFDYVTYSSNTIFFNSKNEDYAVAHITHKGLHEPTESRTPALDRAREAGYEQCSSGTCTCLDCKYSRTQEYAGGGTKFVCDDLNIQTHKCAWCRHFKLRKGGVSNESICRDCEM